MFLPLTMDTEASVRCLDAYLMAKPQLKTRDDSAVPRLTFVTLAEHVIPRL